ncbi:MAG: tRNA 4-thiouridine(8) synthase ThiI, partial [Bacilli bacterium]|nr:tRNA 4-thiouridine(8) synthase ThiI [Bacilli bacterium]
DLECLYFESPPHTSIEAKNKVLELAKIINNYSGNIKVNIVHFTELQEMIYKSVPDSYIITIMRRMMYRIAEKIAARHKCKVIINGESIGQVASQTLDSMVVINNVTNLPVIRPVACLDKLEIIDLARKINTYETSILPYEDCCTIFLPKHPVINPVLNKCLEYEKRFDYEKLIEDAVNNIEVIYLNKKKIYQDLL